MQLLALLTIITVSCQGQQEKKENGHMKETFEWNPGIGCAKFYPMESYKCNFVFADGSAVGPVSSDFPTGLWGEQDGGSFVGDNFKPIPERLDVTWLSFTENKFYTGSFKLPYDSILQLFRTGVDNFMWDNEKKIAYSRHDTYNLIIAGLAPGGVVVVWLQKGAYQVEVARFQAKEASVDMKSFMRRDDLNVTKDDYVKSMMEGEKDVTDNLAKNGIPYGLWDKYRERFNMRPIVKYDQHHIVKTDKLYISFFNGEKDDLFLGRIDTPQFIKRARTKYMAICWSDSLGFKIQPYILEINFDEAEMFKAYKEIYGDDPNQEGELVVEVNRGNDQYKVFLETKDKKIQLLQDKGQIYFDK
jgi:hypothetical protein